MNNKIQKLQKKIKELNLDGYVVTSSDEFGSEYPPKSTKRLEYLLDFSCSNAVAIILREKVILITDSRYILEASSFASENFIVLNFNGLEKRAIENVIEVAGSIGYFPKIMNSFYMGFIDFLPLVKTDIELVETVWEEKTELPIFDVFEYDYKYSGESSDSKIQKLREIIKNEGADGAIITSPESVCWTLNIRSYDSEFSPVVLSYLYIDFNKVILFCSSRKFKFDVNFEIRHISEIDSYLASVNNKIIISDNANSFFKEIISSDKKIIKQDPTLLLKSQKNNTEILGSQNAHIEDGIALAEFYCWLESNFDGKSEYDLSKKLTEFRSRSNLYIMDSFPPICGLGANGAKIHYKPSKEGAKILNKNNMLLIDSGGHYYGGTTDVTRTTILGSPTFEQKNFYTRVLKGHINLAKIKFPKGIKGAHLDAVARMNLWDICADYAHSTGHGVGNALSVHEWAANISLSNFNIPFLEGMIVSNEPGFYKDGEFGIRIENLQFVKSSNSNSKFLEFEQLTLVPYCSQLIIAEMLSLEEKNYLINYNNLLMEKIYPMLTKNAKIYMEKNLYK
jgi:Xaa-Pro aminopeptidase